MKLSHWAREQGVSYQTALRWFHANMIQNAKQMLTGTIVVTENRTSKEVSFVCDPSE